jgi:transcriptional regulator with XRE-family HTH domain
MEKKTIGQFISVLRKANGMTQKELAEKLYVSDKTVSRWECDESTPDLALIPVLAEIFQITTDELLRGERKNPEKEGDDGGRYALKSEKAWKNLLYTRKKKYDTLTFISLGLSIGGWLVGILCNFAFYNGVLGFVLGTIFLLFPYCP